jgi:5-methylcytosine-specific restriction endonuclease McrA
MEGNPNSNKVLCDFCGRDFSHGKDAKKNRSQHERRMHKLEYEKRKQSTVHDCVECSNKVPYGKLFCKKSCRQRAKAVRYIRSTRNRGVHEREDIKNAINEKILWAYHGGYVSLPLNIRAQVWERDDGKCVQCNQEGAHVDHPQNSIKIDDAKLLCEKCHEEKTLANRRALDPNNPTDVDFILYIEKVYEDSFISEKPQHVPNWDYNKLRMSRMRPTNR